MRYHEKWKRFDFSRLQEGPLYYYVGAGLSMGAGLVGWNEMACLIWRYLKYYEKRKNPKSCPAKAEENAHFIQEFIAEKESPTSAVPIMSRNSRDQRAMARTALLNMMLRIRAPRVKWLPKGGRAIQTSPAPEMRCRPGQPLGPEDLVLHSLVWRSHCHGVFTTNYDVLLEHAYSLYSHGADLRSYRHTANFLRYLVSNPRFVLKLHGDINDLATMEFNPTAAWKNGGKFGSGEQAGDDLKEIYGAVLAQGHMIYLGCGFCDETIKQLHKSWLCKDGNSDFCRVALIPSREKKVANDFPSIEFLTYEDSGTEVKQFLDCVVGARRRLDHPPRPRCREASSLHEQIFLSAKPVRPAQRFETELWSCGGKKIS